MTPEGWSTKRLEQLVDVLDSRRRPLNGDERARMRGPYPYYGANGQVDSVAQWIFDEPLILLAEDGGHFEEYQTRRIAYEIKGKSWVNNHAHVLRVLPGWCHSWVLHALAHKDVRPFINGGTRTKLNQADLRRIELIVPPLWEQKKIAAILTAVDEAIEATQAVIDQLQVVKSALMSELLTRGLPGRHAQFKDTPFGPIPAGWQLREIHELGIGSESVRSGPFGSSLKTKDFVDSGTPVITIQALGRGTIVRDGLFHVNGDKATELSEYRVRANDVVFSRVADIGRCVPIGEAEAGWIISSNLSRIRLNSSIARAFFVASALSESPFVLAQLAALEGNAGRPVITSSSLKRIVLVCPSVEEQIEFEHIGAILAERQRVENEKYDALCKTKDAMSSALLTGSVRVAPEAARA